VITCECGFSYAPEFQEQYPEVVEQWHKKDHDAAIEAQGLRLQVHILETLERLSGEGENK
jgi:hypothetical protein